MSHPDSTSSPGNGTAKSKEDFPGENVAPVLPDSTMESLGEALAGVSLSSTSKSSSSSFGSSAINAATFALAPRSNSRDNDGWGNFTSPSNNNLVVSDDSGAVVDSHVRNESLELFLSQSPSQTLGDDVFRFSHTNLPSLAEERHASDEEVFRIPGVGKTIATTSQHSGFGEFRPQENSNRRRVESPSCSVTGTTTSSRSVSPYGNINNNNSNTEITGRGGAIPAYQRFETSEANRSKLSSFGEEDRTSSIYNSSLISSQNGHHSQPSTVSGLETTHRSPYAAARNRSHVKSPYDQFSSYDRSSSLYNASDNREQQLNQMSQLQIPGGHQQVQQQQQQQQVLYMAVPSPDGNGQVLQPVQMMQMPGKPYTFVIPGGAHSLQGFVQQGGENLQMVLPNVMNQQQQQSTASDYSNSGGIIPNSMMRDDRRNHHRYGDAGGGIDDINNSYGANDGFGYGSGGSRAGLGGMMDDYKLTNLNQDLSVNPYTSDPTIASLYAAPQRPPLDALLGQVRRLSRDQVGCRLVQQALDEEGPMAATLILNEGLPFWGEAMVDPFGNYLFQKIIEKITPEERIMLVKSVSTRLVNASLNLHGTRSVQKVVELCAQDELDGNVGTGEESAALVLTRSLAPAAARLCIDSHGNHVIQRILLRLSPMHSQFVFDAVAASVGDVARHRHGCCVIQRCLDSPPSPARAHLVRRIVEKSLELMQDAYGNYVVQYVLDVCSDEDVHAVCESVVGKVNLLAIQKFSSNVMEKCLERCSDRVKESYLHEMSDPERIRELMMDPFGNYVVQRALSVATHTQAIRLVEAMRPHLIATQAGGPGGQRNGGVRNTAGGRRIIAKICRRFPNFTLNPVGTQEELYSQNKGANHRYLNHHQQGHHIVAVPHHNIHKHAAPMLATYAPIGTAPSNHHAHMQPHYGGLTQSHMSMQQQPSPHAAAAYGVGLAGVGGNPYYDPFATSDGLGSYPGL